jgi:hypothetical protein
MVSTGLLLLPLLLVEAAQSRPFSMIFGGTVPQQTDKSMVMFPIPNQTNQITVTPAGEVYQTSGTAFPEGVVVSAWQEIGTLAKTDAPLAAILRKYNVSITAADGTPVFP